MGCWMDIDFASALYSFSLKERLVDGHLWNFFTLGVFNFNPFWEESCSNSLVHETNGAVENSLVLPFKWVWFGPLDKLFHGNGSIIIELSNLC